MKHIRESMNKVLERASKAKFYRWNKDVFLRYFESEIHYEALINAGNFEKLERIIREVKNENS